MKTFTARALVVVALFALYMVHPLFGYTGLAGAFAYVFAQRARSRRGQAVGRCAEEHFTSMA